jgi:hypothetical protein
MPAMSLSRKEKLRRSKMPLTKTGKKIEKNMKKEYGEKKGESVFYATMHERKEESN